MVKLWLKRLLYRLKYYKKRVNIRGGVELDMNDIFEGHNFVGKNSTVVSSVIGLGTYIAGGSVIRKAQIGRFCSIGANVQTGLGTHPTSKFVSTHPAFFSTQKQAGFSFTNQDIFEEHKYIDTEKKYVVRIGNDVWVGNNVIITDGLHIGDGAIIAAGAVLTKNVPPYAVFAGVPARLIKYRFSEDEIERLNKVKWWDWDLDKIKSQSALFNDVTEFLIRV